MDHTVVLFSVFLRNLHPVFHIGLHKFTSPQQYRISPDPSQHLLFLVFARGISIDVRWFIIVILVYMSVIIMLSVFHAGHLYIHFGKMFIRIICPSLIRLFLWYWVVWVLYTFLILAPCHIYALQIFSPIL